LRAFAALDRRAFTRHTTLLAFVLGGGGRGSIGMGEATPVPEGIGPESLVRFLCRHKLAGILDVRLDQAQRARLLPHPVLVYLADEQVRRVEKNHRQIAELFRLIDGFEAAGVEVIPLKGAGLSRRAWGAENVRSSTDVDLLVRERDVDAAEAALGGVGYRMRWPIPDRRAALAHTHGFDFIGHGLKVDLHWTFERHPTLRFDEDAIWERRRTQRILDRVVPALGAEDELVQLLLSVFGDLMQAKLKLRLCADVIALACAYGSSFDWAGFFSRRKAEGMLDIALFALLLSVTVLRAGSSLPGLARELRRAHPHWRMGRGHALALLTSGRDAPWRRLRLMRLYACPLPRALAHWLVSIPVRRRVYRGGLRRG
jgi:hypothetical protein